LGCIEECLLYLKNSIITNNSTTKNLFFFFFKFRVGDSANKEHNSRDLTVTVIYDNGDQLACKLTQSV